MRIEQFVMAYHVEQDRLRALLPTGFESLRPVLRINAEIRDDEEVYLEFNVPVATDDARGWLNIACWDNASFHVERNGKKVTFVSDFLEISFSGVGIEGGCPAEKENDGCYYRVDGKYCIRVPETIVSPKEFCDCEFRWLFSSTDAHGVSQGKTIPAFSTEQQKVYEPQEFTVQNAAAIPCDKVLGSYKVLFARND